MNPPSFKFSNKTPKKGLKAKMDLSRTRKPKDWTGSWENLYNTHQEAENLKTAREKEPR